MPNYFIDFIKGNNDTLFITFEHAGNPLVRPNGARKPWGLEFLVQKRGFSLLGVKPKYVDWYRKNDLHEFSRSAEFLAFVSGFEKVILYGASMGGYAALAFAEAIPSCTVIALDPQSTLNKQLVPWERRFKNGWNENWQSDFNDAAVGATFAKTAYVAYDPFCKFDKMHVDRLDNKNVIHLRVPLVGHAMSVWLVQMGILGKIVDQVVADNLTEHDFHQMAQTRKNIPRYFVQMASNAKGKELKRNCLNKALVLNPMDRDALSLLCHCLLDESKWVEVLIITENILQAEGTEFAYRAYRGLGRLDKASDVLTQLISGNKKIPLTSLLKVTELALSADELEIAEQLLNKAVDMAPSHNKIKQLSEVIRDKRDHDKPEFSQWSKIGFKMNENVDQETVAILPARHSPRRIKTLAESLNAQTYLEIGVNKGQTFFKVSIPQKTAVDPKFLFDVTTVTDKSVTMNETTSDEFFSTLPVMSKYDVIFIDGLHTFEQTYRDMCNSLLHSHERTIFLIDDTQPSDVYSSIPQQKKAAKYRKQSGGKGSLWHGDVFKVIFALHDFHPALNYRTIIGSGNPQTLVWRSNSGWRKPLFNSLEVISRLNYFDLLDHIDILKGCSEEEAISLCLNELANL